MGRFLKVLGGVLAVVVVVAVGAVVYALNIDLNEWKPEIEEAAREATGRTLTINGPIEFELGTDTYLKATDITFSNVDWSDWANMAEVDTFELGLKLFSLLGDTPDITMLRVEGVRAIIETNADGVNNTAFRPPGEMGPPGAEEEADHRGGGGDILLPILRDLRIADVNVTLRNGVAGTQNQFTVSDLTLGSGNASDPITLNLDAALDALPLVMSGEMGSLQSMTRSGTPTPIDLAGDLAGLAIDVGGQIQDLAGHEGFDVKLTVNSEEIGELSAITKAFGGAPVPALGPLKVALALVGGMDDGLSVQDLVLSLGHSETLLVEANGGIVDVQRASGINLDFRVVSPNLSAAMADLPSIGPLEVAGSMSGDPGSPITLDPFKAEIGGSDVSGTASIDPTGSVPKILARFTSQRFDLNDVTGGDSSSVGTGAGGTSSGAPAAEGGDSGKVIPGDPLPLDGLRNVNADIRFTVQTFIGAVAELTALEVGVVLDDGSLTVSPLKAGVGGGSLDGSISLDGGEDTPPLSISINGTAMDLAALFAEAGFRDKIVGPMDLKIDLKGAGASPRAIAASLNGDIDLSMYGTRILKKAFEEQFGDTLGGLLASEGGWIVIDCAVFGYDISQGLMETKAGYTASGPITVATEGTIDLGVEALDLRAKPAGGGFASVPVLITGSFAAPSVVPDPVAIGTGLLANVLTGGLSTALLAVVADLPEGHPCKQEVAESQEQAEAQPSDSPAASATEAVEDALQDAGRAVEGAGQAIQEGLGGALQGIFGSGD